MLDLLLDFVRGVGIGPPGEPAPTGSWDAGAGVRDAGRFEPGAAGGVDPTGVVAMHGKDSSAVSAEAQTAEGCFGLCDVVPRLRTERTNDRAFVALAGQEHDVARACSIKSCLDGGASVGDDQ